jgi:hypothetical protein
MNILKLSEDLLHFITHWLSDAEYFSWLQSCTLINRSLKCRKYVTKGPYFGPIYDHGACILGQIQFRGSSWAKHIKSHQWQGIRILTLMDLKHEIQEWPSRLVKLTIQCNCHQPWDHLPDTLTDLTIQSTDSFTEFPASSLDHLPVGLTHLHLLNNHENLDICLDYLPEHLQTLEIKAFYQRPLDYLPEHLQVLQLYHIFNYPLDYLPDTLKELSVESSNYSHPLDYLPTSLKRLKLKTHAFMHHLDYLPEGLEHLILSIPTIDLDYLPSTLRVLDCDFMRLIHQIFHHLPVNLQYLSINGTRNLPVLPTHLHQLFWVRRKSHLALANIATELKELCCNASLFTERIEWPAKLTHLWITNNQPDLGNLPETLQYLTLDSLYSSNDPCWPKSLRYLFIHKHMDADSVPKNHIEEIRAFHWNKGFNRYYFPHLKRVYIFNSSYSFSWREYDSTCEWYKYELYLKAQCHVSIPHIWPLKLYRLDVIGFRVQIDAPDSQLNDDNVVDDNRKVFAQIGLFKCFSHG